MPSAVVRPIPPGQVWPAGSAAMLANTLALPAGETWTMVFPVPCTLALSLKLVTRTSPAVSRPPEAGTTATPYGFTSPLPGTVEATWVSPCSWPRNAADCGAAVRVVVGAVRLDELEVDVDEQAVAVRPRPTMAVRILARLRDFTVLPFRRPAPSTSSRRRFVRLLSVRAGVIARPWSRPNTRAGQPLGSPLAVRPATRPRAAP